MTPGPLMGPAKTKRLTVKVARARSAASTYRRTAVLRPQRERIVTTVTMAGTNASSVRALEKNLVLQTNQYGSCSSPDTAAAAGNEDTKGATSTAPPMKTAIRRSVSKRAGPSLNWRTKTAAVRASQQRVANSARTSGTGQEAPSSATRWAGKAASR